MSRIRFAGLLAVPLLAIALSISSGAGYSAVASPVAAAQATESVPLLPGCNNVTLTWPVGTSVSVVAEAVSPSASLLSIFRSDPTQGRFLGFNPDVPEFANDYTTIGTNLETVFICISTAGTFTRPA